MDLMDEFRGDVVRILSKRVPSKYLAGLERPPEHVGSDLAFPCFILGKKKSRNPAEVARDTSRQLKPAGLVGAVDFYGAYINFYINWKKAASLLLKGILKEKERYGSGKPAKKKVMVEYAHPNTHKAFHIGHVRNICLGESLSRILESTGLKVVRANYQGDIGPHIAKFLWGFEHIYKGKAPSKDKGRWLGEVYRKAGDKIEKSKKAQEEVREINRKLYARDKQILPVWEKTKKWSLDYFRDIYRDFGVKFDRLYMESEVEKQGVAISQKLVKKKIAKKEGGAIIVNLEKQGLGVFVLVSKEGYALYHAKDFHLGELQIKEFNPSRIIHVVASEQNLFFRQLFKLFEIMKWKHADREFHLSYGLVNMESGKKMKSRSGGVVIYDDLREELHNLARKETSKRNPKLSSKELGSISKSIGLGALKYAMIHPSPEKVIVFNWERVLSFEGDSGPYIQYSHARAMSILRKAGSGAKAPVKKDSSAMYDARELALFKQLADFPGAVQRAGHDLRPHYIANYALDLATKFNEFYQAVPVLKAPDKQVRLFRLALVRATAQTLKNSLELLEIEAPDRM
jgi:arginyl-tRNA synthetase